MLRQAASPPVGGSSISGDDTAIAYQGIVGLAYEITQSVSLKADYRYFATNDLDLTTAGGTAINQEYANHAILVGLSFNFGNSSPDTMPEVSDEMPTVGEPVVVTQQETAPEPEIVSAASEETQMAAAPAMPTFPTAYRVLFDWNSVRLNIKAMSVIREAAANAMEGEVIRIRATGHADRSGTMKNNTHLSRHRTEVVRDAMIGQGVKPSYITIDWFGEDMPVLMTPDNEREPQNRRVEIIFPQ